MVRAVIVIMCCVLLPARAAHANSRSFEAGALVIPMDTTYQDHGMFKAFGLVYALLRAGVPVQWVIAPGKSYGDADFTASATDHATGATITDHAYRAGPFVVAAADAAAALPIVDLWQAAHVTTVHVTTTPFVGFVSKELVAAPTIAVFSDGNEDIAFGYLNAAGIPDSLGQGWPTKKAGDSVYPDHPDALDVGEVAGPTTTSHTDGALFDDEGNPVYCQIMTMHWDVDDVVDEVVAEMRAFLEHPTHVFAECQAVNALENNLHGRFLTTNGFLIAAKPAAVTFLNADYPFAQMDGAFGIAGGSEPAYSLPAGDVYKDSDVVMITGAGSPTGVQDVWMTGYLDGRCYIDTAYGTRVCPFGIGKVSYLGGHKYETKLPLSGNPASQGTRLFLNSLFEADCAIRSGQPYVTLALDGPTVATSAEVTYTVTLTNFGPGPLLDVVVDDALPLDVTLVAATEPHTLVDGEVRWALGNVGEGASRVLEVTVALPGAGVYVNAAGVDYLVGVSPRRLDAPPVETHFGGDVDEDGCLDTIEAQLGTSTATGDTDEDGYGDCEDVCPTLSNPAQSLTDDPAHCGGCGEACALPQAEAACEAGECVIGKCLDGYTDADRAAATGCEVACTTTAEVDDDCDGADDDCDGVADDDWVAEGCGVGACASFSACVDGAPLDCAPRPAGSETADAGSACDNGVDDDCDGQTDAADPSCAPEGEDVSVAEVVEPDPEPEPEPDPDPDPESEPEPTGCGSENHPLKEALVLGLPQGWLSERLADLKAPRSPNPRSAGVAAPSVRRPSRG
ncbi:MAG: DUF11 domain-containing protein, partial [Deltaproteobacteria bacterium]|nr:DUF11 domain-containing protein [Deltaproteobacteria bacterium]